jgi:tetratricopeptide (TPR) repeat protein
MKTLALLLLVFQQAVAQAPIQVPELSPPLRVSPPITPAEELVLREGIALYDQGKYDEAIARYEQVLKQNPDSTAAMYELAMTYSQKRQFQMAVDLAAKGTEYSCPQLPQFYALIGNILDGQGQVDKAIDTYKKGISLNTPNAGTLYLNMGVSYQTGKKDSVSSKAAYKQGALVDSNYPGLHYQLANFYIAQGLKTPLLMAFSRFLVLEPNSPRAQTAYNAWRAMLDNRATPVPQPSSPLYDYVHSPQQTFEGDLTQLDAALITSKAAAAAPGKAQVQLLIDQVDNLFDTYAMIPPGNDKDTFLWKYYIPYFVEMKKNGFVEPFVYYVIQSTNVPAVRDWLIAHPDRVNAFLQWSRTYRWPDKTTVDATR